MARKLPKGIRMRGDRFFVDVTHKGQRMTATCDTLEEAETRQLELKHALMTGRVLAPAGRADGRVWSLQTTFEKCFERHWKETVTAGKTKLIFGEAQAFFGDKATLADLDAEKIEEWVSALKEKGNSNGTINRKMAWLSKIFSHAVIHSKQSGITDKPHLPRQKEPEGRIRFITEAEEETMLHLARQQSDRDLEEVLIIGIDTGMRVSEIWNLTERDVDLRSGMVSIWENKTNHPRSIPMTARVRRLIEERLIKRQGQLFPYSNAWLRWRWDRLRSSMGLTNDPQFVPHAMRHTFASRLAQRGATLAVIQQLMGHKSLHMTMRYSHLIPTNLLDAVALLEPEEKAAE